MVFISIQCVHLHTFAGGIIEYIITTSCVVGMYRLKGAQVSKYLLPEPPNNSTGNFVKDVSEKGVEIMWEPPKKNFTNYSLKIQKEMYA